MYIRNNISVLALHSMKCYYPAVVLYSQKILEVFTGPETMRVILTETRARLSLKGNYINYY